MQQTISVIKIPQFQDQQPDIIRQKEKIYTYLRQLRKIETYIKTFETASVQATGRADDIEHLQIRTYWNS